MKKFTNGWEASALPMNDGRSWQLVLTNTAQKDEYVWEDGFDSEQDAWDAWDLDGNVDWEEL